MVPSRNLFPSPSLHTNLDLHTAITPRLSLALVRMKVVIPGQKTRLGPGTTATREATRTTTILAPGRNLSTPLHLHLRPRRKTLNRTHPP